MMSLLGRSDDGEEILGELEKELTLVGDHEQDIADILRETIERMEEVEAGLYEEEKRSDANAKMALDKLNDVIMEFGEKANGIEYGIEEIRSEIEEVKSDLEMKMNELNEAESQGDQNKKVLEDQERKLEQFENVEERIEENLRVAEKALQLLEAELKELEKVESEAESKLDDGSDEEALREIEKAQNMVANDLQKLRDEFEDNWSKVVQ